MTIGKSLGMLPDTRKWQRSERIADNSTFIGVEIELENLRYFTEKYCNQVKASGLWNIVKDGSLRDSGLEFIMSTANNQPLKGADILRALLAFKRGIKEYIIDGYPPPECTKRTSVHVHMDVRDISYEQLQKLILLYTVFEDTFFKWADPERKFSNYCRSIEYSDDIIDRMGVLVGSADASGGAIKHLLETGNKYDACNYLSIRQRGSLEFRLMRGTYDTTLILRWINILLCLKLAAKDESIVIHSFPDDMSQRGIGSLIDQVFGTWGFFLKDYATDGDILNGVRLAQDILINSDIRDLEEKFSQHSPKTSFHLNAFKATI